MSRERSNAAISWPPTDIQEGLAIPPGCHAPCQGIDSESDSISHDIYLITYTAKQRLEFVLFKKLSQHMTKQMFGVRVAGNYENDDDRALMLAVFNSKSLTIVPPWPSG